MLKFINKFRFFRAKNILKSLGFKEILEDQADGSIVFNFADNKVACLNMNDTRYGYSIEVSLNFDGDLINLKTLSDLASMTYANRCHISRVYPSSERKVRINALLRVGRILSTSSVRKAVQDLELAILTVSQYMEYRVGLLQRTHWDLSMFDGVDLNGFSPQFMAEEMEFVAGSWEQYSDMIKEDYSDFKNHPEEARLLALIAACVEFERANKVQLSQVGDLLADELAESKIQIAASQDNYGVN